MPALHLLTDRLELTPLPARSAAALPRDREAAIRALGAPLSDEWPAADLLGVLGRHAEMSADTERFGVWVMIERVSGLVIGDIGFHGPPDDTGSIEIGYSVIPSRRRRGYATEAAAALVTWASSQPDVQDIDAGCDPGNVASRRTLERVGFRQVGVTNDELRWRLAGTWGQS